jgi:hypothetical protein
MEKAEEFVAWLRSLSDKELLAFRHAPKPFNPHFNEAAIILLEIQRRRLS